MANITYLIGAGASASALPVVTKIPEAIGKIKGFIENYPNGGESNFAKGKSWWDIQNMLAIDLDELKRKCETHASIDTYAKKLFLRKDKEGLEKLKFVTSAFFTLQQLINPADKRYDLFFASILKETTTGFPSNLKILSWNYDNQFEISYSEFSDQAYVADIHDSLRLHYKLHKRPSLNNDFGIWKLNGTIGFQNHGSSDILPFVSSFHKDRKEAVKEILTNYINGVHRELIPGSTAIQSSMSFAWEQEKTQNTLRDSILPSIEDTNVLVVIGYSFPYFNREIDSAILNKMGRLEKVYFQSLDDFSVQVSRFNAVRPLSEKFIKDVRDPDQFFIPPEL